MTLDIRPDSQSVREKLSSLVNSRRREIVKSLDSAHPLLMDRTGKMYVNSRSGHWNWYWSSPERRRAVTVAAVVAVVLCAVFAPTEFGGRSAKIASEGVFTTGTTPTNTSLVLSPVSSTGQPKSILAPLPQTTPDLSYASQASAATIAPQTIATAAPVRDSNDQSLTQTLQTDSSLTSRGIRVSDAQVDPASQKLTVTFVASESTATDEQVRDLQDSILVARAALSQAQAAAAASVEMRCLTIQQQSPITAPNIAPAATLAFVGTITRASASSAPADFATIPANQLSTYFATTWWQTNFPG